MSSASAGFSLQDVLLLAGIESRSGELVIESGNNIGSLLFHDGRILLAFSPYTRAIGDLLVENGSLTDAELIEVLKQQRSGMHAPVGALLQKTGKVSFETIQKMVHEQIRLAVRDFTSWKNVSYNFQMKDVKPFDSINLPVYEFLPPAVMQSARSFVAGTETTEQSEGKPAPSSLQAS